MSRMYPEASSPSRSDSHGGSERIGTAGQVGELDWQNSIDTVPFEKPGYKVNIVHVYLYHGNILL